MTSLDYEIIGGSVTSHPTNCHSCGAEFNALLASWCRCESKVRSLTCPTCSTCFCRAPSQFRERFWENAPRALRENTNRFRIGDGAAARALDGQIVVPRVLIVDDEEDMRSLVACYVEQMGYAVDSVSSPADAMAALSATLFDVVITDALMPGMDGRELCQKLKEEYGDAIKIVVMTSLYTASRYRTEARFRFKADDYLAKPLPFSVLKATLDRLAPIAS